MDGVNGAAARETEDEKSRRWERRLFVVWPRVELRVRAHHSKDNDLKHRHCVVDKAKLYRPGLKEDFAKRLNIVAELFQMLATPYAGTVRS